MQYIACVYEHSNVLCSTNYSGFWWFVHEFSISVKLKVLHILRSHLLIPLLWLYHPELSLSWNSNKHLLKWQMSGRWKERGSWVVFSSSIFFILQMRNLRARKIKPFLMTPSSLHFQQCGGSNSGSKQGSVQLLNIVSRIKKLLLAL